MDIQSAFGVSSWWLSASGVFIGYVPCHSSRQTVKNAQKDNNHASYNRKLTRFGSEDHIAVLPESLGAQRERIVPLHQHPVQPLIAVEEHEQPHLPLQPGSGQLLEQVLNTARALRLLGPQVAFGRARDGELQSRELLHLLQRGARGGPVGRREGDPLAHFARGAAEIEVDAHVDEADGVLDAGREGANEADEVAGAAEVEDVARVEEVECFLVAGGDVST